MCPYVGFEIFDLVLLFKYDFFVVKGHRSLDVANATLDLFDLEAAFVAQVGALRHLGQHVRSLWPLRRHRVLSSLSVPPLAISRRCLRSSLRLTFRRLLLLHPSNGQDARFLGGLEHVLLLHFFILLLQLVL